MSYARDLQPIFQGRCVICHHSRNNGGLVDIEDPFTLDEGSGAPGLVGSKNVWAEGHPGYSAEHNLLPYDPDGSFIMEKVTNIDLKPGCDPAVQNCKSDSAGFFMPPAPRRLPDDKIAAVRQWIADGAVDGEYYRENVRVLFGDPADRNGFECERAGLSAGCTVCITCHYEGSANPPDLSQPFDPEVGIVGVRAAFRSDLELVKPFDPDASFLVQKLETMEPSSDLGAPMPFGYAPLAASQVDQLRRWILDGAPNN